MSTKPEFTITEIASEPTEVLADRYITNEMAAITNYLMHLRGNRDTPMDTPLAAEYQNDQVALGAVSRTIATARVAEREQYKRQRLYDVDLSAGTEQPIVVLTMAENGIDVTNAYAGGDKAQDLAYLKTVSDILHALCDVDFENPPVEEQRGY
jgi:hypothetical protein